MTYVCCCFIRSALTYATVISAYICYDAVKNIPKNEYCLIMDDEFENLDNWNHEIQLNGFG